MTVVYSGAPAAPGIGIGALYIHHPSRSTLDVVIPAPRDRTASAEHDAEAEWQRFLTAQADVESELVALGQSLNATAADVFSVHQVILHDKTLTESVREAILFNHSSAPVATQQAIRNMAEIFRDLDDEYFASRAADIVDIGRRLLTHLGVDLAEVPLSHLPIDAILVAHDLTPSDIAQLSNERIAGIALAESTPTAHSSILARSLGMPLVCGLGAAILQLESGQEVVLDGDRGELVAQPNPDQLARYRRTAAALDDQRTLALQHVHEQAITLDGQRVPVSINANQPDEVAQSLRAGADGVGLLRTEYLFQGWTRRPTRAEQRAIFREMVAALGGLPLTVRALDAGGDKPVGFLPLTTEENPFLGRRGIRLLLEQPDLLIEQYQALLDVATTMPAAGRLRYMLPMVSTAEEVSRALGILAQAAAEMDLQASSPQAAKLVEIGILIEVPSAALLADQLAPMVDFLSIGTNDLAQYVMASDRTNSAVARLADPFHPAVLQLIGHVCRAGEAMGRPVSLCGEMAGNPSAAPLLLGLGVTELSVPLPAVPLIKQVVRECDMDRCRRLAAAATRCHSLSEVRDLLANLDQRHDGFT